MNDELVARTEGLEVKVDRIGAKIDSLCAKIDRLTDVNQENQTELNRKLDRLLSKFGT